jgi:hypothetical protein
MTQLALIDAFDKAAAKCAIVATYDFDALFFERRMLRTKGFGSAERILILMDRGRYQALIQQGLPVAGFNRRYLVVPISRARSLPPCSAAAGGIAFWR